MKRKTGTAMSGAERAEKKRRKASLFPAKAATLRENDAERKRKAPSDESAQRQGDAAEEAERAARAATASSWASSAELRLAHEQHVSLLRQGDAALESCWSSAEERQEWLDMPWIQAEREWRHALEARAAGEGWSLPFLMPHDVVGTINEIRGFLEDAASYADELREGAKANEWRRQEIAVARIEAPTLQAMRALLRDVYDAWCDVRERVAADREAADQRGEGWWRDLWSRRDAEDMCEAWQGPLPAYGSIVCTCCSHEPYIEPEA